MTTDAKRTQKVVDQLYQQASELVKTFPEQANKTFLALAKQGHAKAQFQYAYSCYTGRGMLVNMAQAAHWYEQAANQGDLYAQHNFAVMLRDGEGIARDAKRSLEYAQKAADQGHIEDMMEVGTRYRIGCDGVDPNGLMALKYFNKAFDKGNRDAAFEIGRLYLQGCRGVDANKKEAKNWLQKGCDDPYKDPNAAHLLGDVYGEEQDKKQATACYQKAFDLGKKEHVATLLGEAYYFEKGVKKDLEKAAYFLRIGAQQKDSLATNAANALGRMLLYGDGIPKDEAEGVKYLQQAADKNFDAALLTMGHLNLKEPNPTSLRQDKRKGLEYYQRAYDQHRHPKAALALGGYHLNGIPGILDPNPAKGLAYLKEAAERGDADAANAIGFGLTEGIFPTQGEKSPLSWLEKAHQLGDKEASYQLGHMHQTGWGDVKRNPDLALKYFRTAAERGFSEGQFIYAVLIKNKNPVSAAGFYEKAAAQGHVAARYNLGLLHIDGINGTKNEQRGWSFIEQAATAGHPMAAYNLGVKYFGGDGVDADLAKAMPWFKVAANKGHGMACAVLGSHLWIGKGIQQDLKAAEKYFRRAAAEGVSSLPVFFLLAGLIAEKDKDKDIDDELVNYIAIGDPVTKEEPHKQKRLYSFLKRLAQISKFIRKREVGPYSIQFDKIYAALEAEFELLSSGKDEKGAPAAFEAKLGELEVQLSQLEQVKAKWKAAEAEEKAKLKAAEAKKHPSPQPAEVKESAVDTDSDDESDTAPSSAPIQDTNKDQLPAPIVALRSDLFRLEIALGKCAKLAQSNTAENLTERRDGLLEIMGTICRRLIQPEDSGELAALVASLGKYSIILDPAAQLMGNYCWHAGQLKEPITLEDAAGRKKAVEQLKKIQQIEAAARKILGCFSDKNLASIKEGKSVQQLTLSQIKDEFLTEASTQPCVDIDPDVVIEHYKKVFAAGFKNRGYDALTTARWLRLVGMTESAYAQIRDNREKYGDRYKNEQLWREHRAVKRLGKWIRHRDDPDFTAERLGRLVQREQKRSKQQAQRFSSRPVNLRSGANVPISTPPAEHKEVKVAAPASAIPGADDALKELAQQIAKCQSWGRIRNSQPPVFTNKELFDEEGRANEIANLFKAVNEKFRQGGIEVKQAPGTSKWRVYIPATLLEEELARRKAQPDQLPDAKNPTAISTAAVNLAQSWGRSGAPGTNPVTAVAATPQPTKESETNSAP